MRFLCNALALLIICASGVTFAADEMSELDQYQQERVEKWPYERFVYALDTLQKTQDIKVVNISVQDVVRYSTINDEYQKALDAIDSLMERLALDDDAHLEASLARGKLLARLNQWDEAYRIFHNAISSNWKNALLRYSESLIESDRMVEALHTRMQPHRWIKEI